MSRKLELELEKKICREVVRCLIKAGYAVTVDNGDTPEGELKPSRNENNIMGQVWKTDEDLLLVNRKQERGWVKLIWGNVEGIISDYTVNLEETLAPALALSREYQD